MACYHVATLGNPTLLYHAKVSIDRNNIRKFSLKNAAFALLWAYKPPTDDEKQKQKRSFLHTRHQCQNVHNIFYQIQKLLSK